MDSSTTRCEIALTPVESKILSGMGFDHISRTLRVGLRGGGVYEFYNVPPEVFEGLLRAESKGRYYNRRIKHVFRHKLVA